MNEPVVVIGGGGAGLIAAWRAASAGAPVILLERNRKLGIKLLISGGGKCNITHAGSPDELLAAFRPRERHFLKPSFHRFSSENVRELLASHQVGTFVRDNGRVFPESGRAGDVVHVLEELVREAGVDVRLERRIETVKASGASGFRVEGNGVALETARLIIATGGLSYARTGTTGDGYAWSRDLGHTIVLPRPALAPIGIEPPLPTDWKGIALRGGRLSVIAGGKAIASWDGDILFSHEGITGPAALEVSLDAAAARERGPVHLLFDFVPGREFADLDAELNEIILRNRGKMLSSALEAMLPNRIIAPLLKSAGVDPDTRGHIVTREQRRAVTALLKGWKIGHVGTISLDRGEVTAGGVKLAEVDPHSMRSRRKPGLYLCGEVLDVAGPVGGYNLQAAFSTGFVAGETAARDWPD